MSGRVLIFPPKETPKEMEPTPEPANQSCYYSDEELHRIMQDLIDAGHKYLVEVHLIACRDFWAKKDSEE